MSLPTTDRGGIQQAIRALRDDGWNLYTVDDGEETIAPVNETEAVEAIMAVDVATLHLVNAKSGEHGSVLFVLGNSPEEVVCDYTVNLTALDALIDSWA